MDFNIIRTHNFKCDKFDLSIAEMEDSILLKTKHVHPSWMYDSQHLVIMAADEGNRRTIATSIGTKLYFTDYSAEPEEARYCDVSITSKYRSTFEYETILDMLKLLTEDEGGTVTLYQDGEIEVL